MGNSDHGTTYVSRIERRLMMKNPTGKIRGGAFSSGSGEAGNDVIMKLERSYRGTSVIRNSAPLGPCSRKMPSTLWQP